ncbi:MAG: hypothetical protein JXQ96_20760 [Cyclobacteriaceae bacterium]
MKQDNAVLNFIFSFMYGSVEKEFFRFKNTDEKLLEDFNKIKENYSNEIPNQYFLHVVQFIESFEKSLFESFETNDIKTVHPYLERVKDNFGKKATVLVKLVDSYAHGLVENSFQLDFYNRMILSIESIISGSHNAFKSREQFLSLPNRLKYPKLPVGHKKINPIDIPAVKPMILLSPEKVEKAFEELINHEHCCISSVDNFIRSAFKFKNMYDVEPNLNSSYTFYWKKKHHLTKMMFDLLDRNKIQGINKTDLQKWIHFFNDASLDSIRKYSSKSEKFLEGKRIDIQIFS